MRYQPKKPGVAGFRRRLAAFLIDVIPITILVGVIFYFLTDFGPALDEYMDKLGDQEARKNFLKERNEVRNASALLYLVCAAIFESSFLQATLGKLAVGVVVVGENGNRLSFGRALARNVSKMISILPAFIGCLAAIFNESRQAWHDRWVKSFVIEGDFLSRHPGNRNSPAPERLP